MAAEEQQGARPDTRAQGGHPDSPAHAGHRVPRGKSFAIFVPVVIAIVALDQISKAAVRASIPVNGHVPVLPGLFDFTLIYNEGAAFGMMQGATTYFVVVAAIVAAIIVGYLALGKNVSGFEIATLSMICGGSIGNAIDRILFDGHVTDYIETLFISFPIFNVADIGVTCGCILLVIYIIATTRKMPAEDPKQAAKADLPQAAGAAKAASPQAAGAAKAASSQVEDASDDASKGEKDA